MVVKAREGLNAARAAAAEAEAVSERAAAESALAAEETVAAEAAEENRWRWTLTEDEP